MIKRILVPLDSSPFSEAAVNVACSLAKAHGAEITGLVVLDIPGIERSLGPVPIGGLYYAERAIAEEERQAEAKIRTLLSAFQQKCQSQGVAHAESERQGSPPKSIAAESLYFDAVIMGLRTYFHFESSAGADQQYGTTDDRSGRSLEKVMNHSAAPILAVPLGWALPDRKLRALVAFDGSLPSTRALHAFVQLFGPGMAEVTVLTCCEDMAEGRFRLDQAADYLSAYGFSSVQTEWTAVEPRQIVSHPAFAQADLIALGAHSQRALIDFMIGSLCKDLIDRADKALLIGH